MPDKARDFGLFIDGLRLDRNITREELTEGIISLSQYKRYLRGDSSIPNSVLIQIADRLKFSISDIHLMFRLKSDKQYKIITEIYNKTKENKFEEAKELANEMKNETTLSDYNKLFFDFCMIDIQHNLTLVSDIHVLDMYSSLINYPDCIDNDSFNWVEINTLLKIVLISAKMENYESSKIMYETMISDRFTLGYTGDTHFLPGVYATLSQIFGKQESYSQVVDLTLKGITYCRKYEVSTNLSNLFLLNSFANMDLGNMELAKESAKKAYMQAYLDNDQAKFEIFSELLLKRFGVTGKELLCI
jgi:transcriptional regulator with XRE-family HTH domain